MNSPPNELLRFAHGYGRRGWPVLPLHAVLDGRCSCGRTGCSSPGKHPRIPNGVKGAKSDPETIAGWWDTWPDSNIGIATGAVAGIVVIDIDLDKGGVDSWAELVAAQGEAPTLETKTGGGGRHLIYKHPGEKTGNRTGIQPGIDVRGDGGYIVAPPSVHASGGSYEWPEDWREWEPAPMPDWLLDIILNPRTTSLPPPACPNGHNGNGLNKLLLAATRYVTNAGGVEQGRRNSAAFNLAGHLAAFVTESGLRLSEAQILDLLRPWNHRNLPPLDDKGLAKAVASAMKNGTPRQDHLVRLSESQKTKAGEASKRKPKARPVAPFKPFPVHLLPEPGRSFVTAIAGAIGCDESYLALPLLAGIASAIGNTWCIRLTDAWTEPCILWVALVGESGTKKSPALAAALEAVEKRDRQATKEYNLEVDQYKQQLEAWMNSKKSDARDDRPTEPVLRCFCCRETTVEALMVRLFNQERGLILICDELSGFMGNLDRYAQRMGGDVSQYLQMFNARSMSVDRKTGEHKRILIPRASLSIVGGIQPGVLARSLGIEHRENGLAARFLFAYPPRKPHKWKNIEPHIDPAIQEAVQSVFDQLYELVMDFDTEGDPRPHEARLAPKAVDIWEEFYDEHEIEMAGLTGDLAAAWSKLQGYAARLTLVIHFIRWAAGELPAGAQAEVDADSVRAGIGLATWCKREAERIYGVLAEKDTQRDQRQLAEWIRGQGGAITIRELLRHQFRRFKTADGAREALQELVEAGLGYWEQQTRDGPGPRPEEFRLHTQSADDRVGEDPQAPRQPVNLSTCHPVTSGEESEPSSEDEEVF